MFFFKTAPGVDQLTLVDCTTTRYSFIEVWLSYFCAFLSPLNISVLDHIRWLIRILLPRNVIHGRTDGDSAKHHTIPVHRLRIHRCCRREEAEDEERNEKDLRGHINSETPLTQGELAVGHRFAAKPLRDDTTDGDDI